MLLRDLDVLLRSVHRSFNTCHSITNVSKLFQFTFTSILFQPDSGIALNSIAIIEAFISRDRDGEEELLLPPLMRGWL